MENNRLIFGMIFVSKIWRAYFISFGEGRVAGGGGVFSRFYGNLIPIFHPREREIELFSHLYSGLHSFLQPKAWETDSKLRAFRLDFK